MELAVWDGDIETIKIKKQENEEQKIESENENNANNNNNNSIDFEINEWCFCKAYLTMDYKGWLLQNIVDSVLSSTIVM